MELKQLIEENLKLHSSKLYFNEPMKKHTSFKIGGNAECLIIVKEVEDLKQILKFSKDNKVSLTVIGRGSNILVLDGGIKGITIQIDIKKFEINIKDDYVEVIAGAGNKIMELAQKLVQQEITGFEEISGIPGTIGGAIRMNAGAYGKEMKDVVKDVTFLDYNGNIIKLENEKLGFKYRSSIFCNEKYIVIETTLKFKKGNKSEIKNKMDEYADARRKKQPLEYPNAGSTFKRGEGFITAQLIDECGLKGYRVGGAEVSTKHAGFVVNVDNATAKDIVELTDYIKEKVYKKFQKKIELEIEILGDNCINREEET